MNLMARKKEIEARLTEIRGLADAESDVEKLKAFEAECDSLQNERSQIISKLSVIGKTDYTPAIVPEVKGMDKEALEKRSNDMREGRTITVASDEILLPSYTSNNLAAYPFNEVSTLVDKVHVVNLKGGETYTKSFVKSHGTAGLTGEGEAYSETEPEFGYTTIQKVTFLALQ